MPLPLVIVAAAAENGVIGRKGALAWRMPSDLRHFRRITMGKPVIIGRKTFASLGRPLPGRELIVVTRDPAFQASDTAIAHTPDDAVSVAEMVACRMGAAQIIVAGGAEIYAALIGRTIGIELTQIHARVEGDACFPALDPADWRETHRERHPAGPGDEHDFSFVSIERR